MCQDAFEYENEPVFWLGTSENKVIGQYHFGIIADASIRWHPNVSTEPLEQTSKTGNDAPS